MHVDDRESGGAASTPPALRDNPCWCGANDLQPFSPTYSRCGACQTLVTRHPFTDELFRVNDDSRDFYGKDYWFSHQETDLAQPGIVDRARTDLSERAVHWLRAVLKYRRPPAKILELGSAHGGFVALLRWAGFDAAGLEMSPWVVEFARTTFGVPMYQGAVEQQEIAAGSLDAIALMDVLEHLPDPVGTMTHAASLLKPDGLLLIQTPCYRPGTTYEQMLEASDPFLVQLKTDEHLFLFSEDAIRQLLTRAGLPHVIFEPAIFSHYDMFAVASLGEAGTLGDEDIASALRGSAEGRMIQALLDLAAQRDDAERRFASLVPLRADVEYLKNQIHVIEADRAARLEVIQAQGRALGELGQLRADVEHLKNQLLASEADRAARLDVIHEQGRALAELGQLRADVEYLKNQVLAGEADRAARLDVINEQGRQIAALLSRLEDARTQLQDANLGLSKEHSRLDELRSRLGARETHSTSSEHDRALGIIDALGMELEARGRDAAEACELLTRVKAGSLMRIARVLRPDGVAAALERADSVLRRSGVGPPAEPPTTSHP